MKNSFQASKNIFNLVGDNTLVQIDEVVKGFKGSYYAKWEAANPDHSNKDKIALFIIEEAERKGLLQNDIVIIKTTFSNTGFSLAMVPLIKGYECILAVSSKSSKDKINMLRTLGANVYVYPANIKANDPRSSYQVDNRAHKKTAKSVYFNQYFNKFNPLAHYQTTGPEIWKQTNGELTHLVTFSGTGGTISGCDLFLKEQNPVIKIIGVDAYGSVLNKYDEIQELDVNEIYPYRIDGLGKKYDSKRYIF